MIVMIDNYDSFTYNIVQCIGAMGADVVVYRNDKVSLEEIEAQQPDHIIVSPGPCTPLEAGNSNDVIRHFAGKVPVLGVCLGHQCIGHVFGGEVVLPECLAATAHTPEGELMGVRHRTLAVEGVQFHPESFLTVEGPKLLANFLAL